MTVPTAPEALHHNVRRQYGEGLDDAQLFAVHEVMQCITKSHDLQDALSLIVQTARTFTGAASAAITLLDSSRTLLDFAAVAGANASEILGQSVLVEDALAGQTALTGEVYLAYHPAEIRPLLSGSDSPYLASLGVLSAVVVPIYIEGRSAGALASINKNDDESFTSNDVLRLQLLSHAAALALNTERLHQIANQKQRERDVLFEATRATSSSLNVQEVLSSVLTTMSRTLEMNSGAIYLLNDERTRLYIGAETGLNVEDRDRQLAADSGLAASVLSDNRPILIEDSYSDLDSDDLPLPGMRSLMLAPMIARSSSEGLIVIGSRQAGAYTPEDSRLLAAVSSQAAVALENAWLYEDATRRAQEATAIYELSQTVSASLQLDRVLNFVADSVLNLLHVDKFALFLYNERKKYLEIKIARNISREAVDKMRPQVGEGIAGWVHEFETPTAVQDVCADHRNRSYPIDSEGVTSLVSVPLQSGEQVIGVLHAMSSRRRLFTVGEMELLYTIANQVGAAISNAQMYEDARQQSDEIRKGVRRVAQALGSSLDSQATAEVIAELAKEMSGADRCILYMIDSQGNLAQRTAANIRTALLSDGTDGNQMGESASAWVMRKGRSLTIEDWSREPRFAIPTFSPRDRVSGYLGIPLKLGKDILGVLEIYTREPRRFTSGDIRLLLTFASQASVALKNALLVEQANRRLVDLDTVSRISGMIGNGDAPEKVIPATLSLVTNATHADAAILSRGLSKHNSNSSTTWSWHRESDLKAQEVENYLLALEGNDNNTYTGTLLAEDLPFLKIELPGCSHSPRRCYVGVGRHKAKGNFDKFDRQLVSTTAALLQALLKC